MAQQSSSVWAPECASESSFLAGGASSRGYLRGRHISATFPKNRISNSELWTTSTLKHTLADFVRRETLISS